jgi:hypothetical protein
VELPSFLKQSNPDTLELLKDRKGFEKELDGYAGISAWMDSTKQTIHNIADKELNENYIDPSRVGMLAFAIYISLNLAQVDTFREQLVCYGSECRVRESSTPEIGREKKILSLSGLIDWKILNEMTCAFSTCTAILAMKSTPEYSVTVISNLENG